MPVALGGDEGRDKLRKAAVRGKDSVTRRKKENHLANTLEQKRRNISEAYSSAG